MVWYSHCFQNFPQFTVIHTVKGFGIVNKGEIDVFLDLSCFSHDPLLLSCFSHVRLCDLTDPIDQPTRLLHPWDSPGKNTGVGCHFPEEIKDVPICAGLEVFAGSWKKQKSSRKTSISALLSMPKPLTVWITTNCGKF